MNISSNSKYLVYTMAIRITLPQAWRSSPSFNNFVVGEWSTYITPIIIYDIQFIAYFVYLPKYHIQEFGDQFNKHGDSFNKYDDPFIKYGDPFNTLDWRSHEIPRLFSKAALYK